MSLTLAPDFTISNDIWQCTDTDVQSEPCMICHKTFTTKHYLKIHYRTHTGVKPFGCKICDKAFTTKHYLKIHYRIHTGEKPYVCEICQQAFQTKDSFKVHKRMHTGEEPSASNNVKGTSAQSKRLKKRRGCYSRQKYVCDLCDETFGSKGTLTSHQASHTDKNLQSVQVSD